MVYYQSPYKSDENNLCTVSVFYDCSIPDGNVYVIKICKPFTSVQSSWNYCCISGIWSGAGRFHVYRLCKGNFPEIEEAAMIDGCTPLQTFFKVVFPILKPTTVTVAILEAMWVWNDYLLPSLVLNINKYKTIPIAIQFLKQSHGQIDWGAMMAVLVLAILPIIIFYIACQKYIIEGVLAGAVKG